MSFWELDHPSTHPALIEQATGKRWSYGDLKQAAAQFSAKLGRRQQKQLGFIMCSNTPEFIAAYIGSLQTNTAVALFSSDLPDELLARLLTIYSPDWIFSVSSMKRPADYTPIGSMGKHFLWGSHHPKERQISVELGLLLSTSGSTGTPKLVRLSHSNLQANAVSIREYLELDEQERPITSLPMAYSYGLSVINSHLFAGSPILLTNESVLQNSFWDFVCKERATSFAGVPYTYQMLLRAGLMNRNLPILTWTQAGGRLETKWLEQVHQNALARRQRLFVMYGQTEATARISYVPPENLASSMGSIGIPIPGGHLSVESDGGELVYCGPNVMLGYANNVQDLSKGNELNSELHTGDLARKDANGFFYIVGRMKRFLKLFGLRVSLDDVESALSKHFDSPLACFGSDEVLQIAVEDKSLTDSVRKLCCELFKLHHSVVRVSHIAPLPLTSNGKMDYTALASLATPASNFAAAGR